MTDRERVARAIANAVGCSGYKDGDYVGCLSREHCGKCDCTLSADAALAAMPAWRRIPDEVREGVAPWDGNCWLLLLNDKLPEWSAHFRAIPFVGRWQGGIAGFCFAAPVGCGGFMPEHIAGYAPIPPLPAPPAGEVG